MARPEAEQSGSETWQHQQSSWESLVSPNLVAMKMGQVGRFEKH